MSGCKDGDIEIFIGSSFDLDGDDWHEDWSTEDYRAHGFEEEKEYTILLDEVYREIVDNSGLKRKICCGRHVGGRIGIKTIYKNLMLMYHSINDSIVRFYENGTYEYICGKRGKKNYEYDFNENGEQLKDEELYNFSILMNTPNARFYTPFPNTDNSSNVGMSDDEDSSSWGSCSVFAEQPAFSLSPPLSVS